MSQHLFRNIGSELDKLHKRAASAGLDLDQFAESQAAVVLAIKAAREELERALAADRERRVRGRMAAAGQLGALSMSAELARLLETP